MRKLLYVFLLIIISYSNILAQSIEGNFELDSLVVEYTIVSRDIEQLGNDGNTYTTTYDANSASYEVTIGWPGAGEDALFEFSLPYWEIGDTMAVTTVNYGSAALLDSADVKLIRDSSVSLENTINFIKPNTISGFSFLTNSINDEFESVQNRVELGVFNITKKYKGNADTTTNDELKYEGTVIIKDPQGFNSSTLNVNSGFAGNSPGVYIGEIRAFSSDNNPWTFTNLGSFTAAPSQDSSNRISTQSTEVSIGELFIDANQNPNAGNGGFISIQNTDLSDINPPESVESDSTFTHKLPIVINGETYFMLMKQL